MSERLVVCMNYFLSHVCYTSPNTNDHIDNVINAFKFTIVRLNSLEWYEKYMSSFTDVELLGLLSKMAPCIRKANQYMVTGVRVKQ